MGFKRRDSYRPGSRRNSNGRDSSRPAGGGSQPRHRRRSNSQQASPPRGPAAGRPWNHSGRNFTAPDWSYRQHDASRYGDQRGEGVSSGALGEITNRSPLPSPRARPGRSRSPDEDDEDSLFVSNGPGLEYFEDYAEPEPEPEPLPRPQPTTRQTENQGGQSEFPDAFHRRPEPISASRIASGMYFQARAKPILPPLTSKPNLAQTGENILKPRYISTTSIPIEAPTTQPETASKKPVSAPSKPGASSKPVSPKTAASMKATALAKAAALSKAAAPSKAVAPPKPGTGLSPKLPAPLNRCLENDSSSSAPQVSKTVAAKMEPSVLPSPPVSNMMTTSGEKKSANQEPQQTVHYPILPSTSDPQQSVHYPTLPSTSDPRLPDQSRPENKPDSKPDPTINRSIQKRKVGDPFSAHDLKIIWNQCFEQRQAPDQSRLGHFALPIPSHSLHLVSPAQLERAKRYAIPDFVRFEVTPLQLGGENSRLDQVTARLLHLDPAQAMGQNTTPAYHKLQLRPSTSQTDGLAWPVLRAMQLGWELTARWYKEVIVDQGWLFIVEGAKKEREPDAMDIDDENDQVTTSHDSNAGTGTGLGDFVANELKKNVAKTKLSRDEPKGSADIDDEIGRWLNHVWRGQN